MCREEEEEKEEPQSKLVVGIRAIIKLGMTIDTYTIKGYRYHEFLFFIILMVSTTLSSSSIDTHSQFNYYTSGNRTFVLLLVIHVLYRSANVTQCLLVFNVVY